MRDKTPEVPELLEREAWVTAIKADPNAKLGLRKDGAATKSAKLDADRIKALGLIGEDGTAVKEGYAYDWTMSTERQDRDRDIITLAGWSWTDFMATGAGPVLLCHGSWGVPIAKMPHVTLDSSALAGILHFPSMEEAPNNQLAHSCREMIAFGALSMGSVGFLPEKWTFDEEIKGYRFLEQHLLEFSVCAVPSNPDAVRRAKSAGVNVAPLRSWAEQALDMLDAERKADPLQEIWKATKSPRVWVEGKGGVLVPFERPKNSEAGADPVSEPAAEPAAEAVADAPPATETPAPAAEADPPSDPLEAVAAAFGISVPKLLEIAVEEQTKLAGDLYISLITPQTGQVPA